MSNRKFLSKSYVTLHTWVSPQRSNLFKKINIECETCCKICKQPGDPKCAKTKTLSTAFSGKNGIPSYFYPSNINVPCLCQAMRSSGVVNASAARNASTAIDAKRMGAKLLFICP